MDSTKSHRAYYAGEHDVKARHLHNYKSGLVCSDDLITGA